MFNNVTLIIIFINFFLVSFIFWLITILEIYFNKNTPNSTKNTIYECGFFTINKNIFPVNINTIILLFFVIIYEVEFIILIPFLVNINVLNSKSIFLIAVLLYFIIITLYFDIWLNKIDWVY